MDGRALVDNLKPPCKSASFVLGRGNASFSMGLTSGGRESELGNMFAIEVLDSDLGFANMA